MKKLPRSFYLQSTLAVAKDLLGKYLVRKIHSQSLIGKIVEVEAYLGENDPASHAYRGKTKRNEIMFGKGGHLYVYFTYGMHFCSNIVTEEKEKGRAVLLRAIEPIQGIDTMSQLRAKGQKRIVDNFNLANGPAKLCEAFKIRREQNGTDLLGDEIFVTKGEPVVNPKIKTATRIGISTGADKKWRFYIKNNLYVSKK